MGYDQGGFGFVFGTWWAAAGAADDFNRGSVVAAVCGSSWAWEEDVFGSGLVVGPVDGRFLFFGGLGEVEVVGLERLLLVVVFEIMVHVGKQVVCMMVFSL